MLVDTGKEWLNAFTGYPVRVDSYAKDGADHIKIQIHGKREHFYIYELRPNGHFPPDLKNHLLQLFESGISAEVSGHLRAVLRPALPLASSKFLAAHPENTLPPLWYLFTEKSLKSLLVIGQGGLEPESEFYERLGNWFSSYTLCQKVIDRWKEKYAWAKHPVSEKLWLTKFSLEEALLDKEIREVFYLQSAGLKEIFKAMSLNPRLLQEISSSLLSDEF